MLTGLRIRGNFVITWTHYGRSDLNSAIGGVRNFVFEPVVDE